MVVAGAFEVDRASTNVRTSGKRRIVAPYVTSWSEEVDAPGRVVERRGLPGIGYADESLGDRDANGVLWSRTAFAPGVERPVFGRVHPMRQRRAMLRLLCQVCAGPADRNDDGVLWLLRDFRDDWPGWPENMGIIEPPVCVDCVRLSLRVCPALRKGAAAFRARTFPVAGVRGLLFAGAGRPRPVGDVNVSLDNPAVHWVQASSLARELHDCTIVDLDELVG